MMDFIFLLLFDRPFFLLGGLAHFAGKNQGIVSHLLKRCIYLYRENNLLPEISLIEHLLVSCFLSSFAESFIYCILTFFINVILWAEWSQSCLRVTEWNCIVVFLGIFQGLQVFKLSLSFVSFTPSLPLSLSLFLSFLAKINT